MSISSGCCFLSRFNRVLYAILVPSIFHQDDWTPLIWAAANGETETAALLIDRGADLEAKDDVRTHFPAQSFKKTVATIFRVLILTLLSQYVFF